MAGQLGKGLLALGIFLFLHAIYSSVHYKSILSDSDIAQASSSNAFGVVEWVPFDVRVEVFAALLFTLVGTLSSAGTMKEIQSSTHLASQSWDEFLDDPNFRTYNHRGVHLRRVAASSGSK